MKSDFQWILVSNLVLLILGVAGNLENAYVDYDYSKEVTTAKPKVSPNPIMGRGIQGKQSWQRGEHPQFVTLSSKSSPPNTTFSGRGSKIEGRRIGNPKVNPTSPSKKLEVNDHQNCTKNDNTSKVEDASEPRSSIPTFTPCGNNTRDGVRSCKYSCDIRTRHFISCTGEYCYCQSSHTTKN